MKIRTHCSNSARFLWKSIPPAIKDGQPELIAAWKIGQKLWVRDYGGVHEAIHGFDWSQQVQGLVATFSGKSLYVSHDIHEDNIGTPIMYSYFSIPSKFRL